MEFTVLKKSKVHFDNRSFRIDAEFFRKEFLDTVRKIEKHEFSYIEDISSWVTQGPNPIFSDTGTPCLTGRNINKGDVEYENSDYVNEEEYNKLARYQIRVGDTLITLKGKGSIGKIGYVTNEKSAIFSRDIGIVRPSKIHPGYLNIFISCKYGKLLVDRGETGGTGQSTLTTSYLKSIPIPRFNFENKVGNLLEKIEKIKELSRKKHDEVQTLLLLELGLDNWKPKHQLAFVKNYSDTEETERIDAEYFQPKYEEIIRAIKNYKGGWDTLGNLVSVKKCIEVGSEEYLDNGIPFIRVSNLSPFEISEEKYLSEELYKSLTPKEEGISFEASKSYQPKKGEIIFSKDATPGIAYYLNEEPKRMIPSGGMLRLKSKIGKVNNEYLTLVLNSMLTKEQVNRDVGGSVILHWRPDQIKETVIPILPKEVQVEIQQKVTESFQLRKQSKHLLECAKQAVEMAIEENEETAINWLKQQTE